MVTGKEEFIGHSVEWDSPGVLHVFGSIDYTSQLKAMARQYELPGIHAFTIDYSAKVATDLQQASGYYRGYLPLPSLRGQSAENSNIDPEFDPETSRPVRLAFLFSRFYDQLVDRMPK